MISIAVRKRYEILQNIPKRRYQADDIKGS